MAYYITACDQPLTVSGSSLVCPGNLVSVEYFSTNTFDVSQLDPIAVVNAFGAGLIVGGVPLLVVFLCRNFLSTLKPHR